MKIPAPFAQIARIVLGCALVLTLAPDPASADSATLDGLAPIDSTALAALSYERARLGARWLAEDIRPGGKYNYVYDPALDRYDNRQYNPVRHGGVTYALYQAYGAFHDESLLTSAEQGARFIVDSSPLLGTDQRAFTFAGRSKLGAQALAIVALLERRRVTGSTDLDQEIHELARFLLSMEIPDQPGRYFQSYGAEQGERLLVPDSNYYPGEALLALIRLDAQFPDGPYLAYAQHAARYLLYVRDGDLSSMDVVPREDQWLTMALAELYRKIPDVSYARVANLQAASMLANQYGSANGSAREIGASRLRNPVNYTSTATKAEALIAVWELAVLRGDNDMEARAAEGARRTAQFLMRVQHTSESSSQFPRPARLVGAWGQDAANPYVRMDFVQHNVSALLGVWRLTPNSDEGSGPRNSAP